MTQFFKFINKKKIKFFFIFIFIGCFATKNDTKPLILNSPFSKIELFSKNNEKIDAYVFKPNSEGIFPAIVALHGCSGLIRKSGQINSRDLDWGKRLSEAGFVVIFPDSLTTRGREEICTDPSSLNMPRTTRPYDVYSALNWLQQQSFVNPKKVALMGWSNGGSSLLWTVDEGSTARPENLAEDFKLAIAFYPGCSRVTQSKNWSPKFQIEILMGEKDDWTNPQFCKKLVQQNENKKIINITMYPEAYHDFDRPNSPLHTKNNLSHVANGKNSATLGTNENARQLAIDKVFSLLKQKLNIID